ncbi:MAG: hypothetical protein QG622_2145 [Actinomycetota bacterium]|nr:hypothetical protein [Actinomycetota bacterium]
MSAASDPAVLDAARDLAARVSGADPGTVRLVRSLSTTWLATTETVVVKVQAPGTSREDLARRLDLAGRPGMDACVVAPLLGKPVLLGGAGPDEVWGTAWPRVEVLSGGEEILPWSEAGVLLARLHRIPLPAAAASLPPQGAVTRLKASVERLETSVSRLETSADGGPGGPDVAVPSSLEEAVRVVRDAVAGLPEACWSPFGGPGRPVAVTHGDWHLGQLGHLGGAGPDRWRLIDVDDLGVGDPAWDLGRPAAFFAAGLMEDAAWAAFLDGYRGAGGPAVPSSGDPWPALDAVAQASLVLAAASAVRRAVERAVTDPGAGGLDDLDALLVRVCADLPGTGRAGHPE